MSMSRRRLLIGLVVVAQAWIALPLGAARAQASKRDAPAANDPFTGKALPPWLAGRQGEITAAVYDIDTGQEYLYHPQDAEKTASTIKVDILATALHLAQLQHHALPANEAAAAVPMITQSDNDAASDLYDDIGGWTAIGPFDRSIGMTDTTPNAQGYFGETYTTAADQIELLKQVMLPGGELSLGSRQYEYELMLHVIASQRWGITGGVPANATVAIKNGWLPESSGWHVNSIGRVQGDGRDYLIAVYTSFDSSWAYGIDTIERIAASAWQAMGVEQGAGSQHYGPTPPPAKSSKPTETARAGARGD
jgi:beta-lactamase class A